MSARQFIILVFLPYGFAFSKANQYCCSGSNDTLSDEVFSGKICMNSMESSLKCAPENINMVNVIVTYISSSSHDIHNPPDQVVYLENGGKLTAGKKHCLGKLGNDSHLVALICVDDCQDIACRVLHFLLGALKIISTIVLFFTAGIYIVLRKLRDLQGSCLLNFLICYIFVYLSNVYDMLLQLNWFEELKTICSTLGYAYYFFVLSSFGWLGISVFNAWKNLIIQSELAIPIMSLSFPHFFFICLSFLRLFFRSWNSHYVSTYISYLIIVHGSTVVIMMIHFYISNIEQPIFSTGYDSCWYVNDQERIWFYRPIEISLGVAAFLLIDCGRRAWLICANNVDNVPAMKTLLKNCSTTYKLYVTVGCTWIITILSANGETSTRYLLQFLVAIQGILIFIILVITEKKTMRALGDSEHCGCNLFPTTWTPVNSERQPRFFSQNEELTDVDLTQRPSRSVGRRHTSLGGLNRPQVHST